MKDRAKILYVFMMFSFLISCQDKENDSTPGPGTSPPLNYGKFLMHLHTYIDVNEVDVYGVPYTTLSGRTMALSMSQLYISDVELVNLSGVAYSFGERKILKALNQATYEIGNVPVGTYRTLRFKVGLNPATNSSDPMSSADSAILNRSEMWFGSSAQPDGYVFMNVQGTIDTTSSMSGPQVPFAYKIGTNAHYVQVTMPDQNLIIEKDGIEYGHIIIDYSQLFNGIPLHDNSNLFVTTPADNAAAIGSMIANNIPSMFIYE